MDPLKDTPASSSLRPTHLDQSNDGSDALDGAAGRRPRGDGEFLAALNEGAGRELLDAYVENRNDRTRNALAVHYRLCAQVVARQTYRTLSADARAMVEVDDLEQTACVLLVALIEKYDCSLGIPLSAFLTTRLKFAMIDDCRAQGLMVRGERAADETRRPKTVSLERQRHAGGPTRTMPVVDPKPGPAERLADKDTRKEVLAHLPRGHRLVAVQRFLRGLKPAAIARRLRVSVDRVFKIQNECLAILGKAYGIAVAPVVTRAVRVRVAVTPRTTGPVATGPLPTDLQRAKAFRRWFVHRVPWAYRKVIAYRYFRNRELDWTARKLGMCPDRVRLLDRQAQPLILRAVAEWGGSGGTALAVPA